MAEFFGDSNVRINARSNTRLASKSKRERPPIDLRDEALQETLKSMLMVR